MIFQYGRLWPDHPFCFRIPYQKLPGKNTADREYKQCPPAIKSTVLNLLEDLEDEEWIYWCIDDKYPIALNLRRLRALVKLIPDKLPPHISGILFCRCRRMLEKEYLTGRKFYDNRRHCYLERKDYNQIWIHQFVKVKVIRHLFMQFPDNIPYAKAMDTLIEKLQPPKSHSLYVTAKNLATFGESTISGQLTLNCHQSLIHHGLPLPESLPLIHIQVTMGKNMSVWSHGILKKKPVLWLRKAIYRSILRLKKRAIKA